MDILITAGGTSEPIDSVRSITNTSTGRLAVEIHRALSEYGKAWNRDITIHYVYGKGASLPEEGTQTFFYPVTDTSSVEETVTDILENKSIDHMIHLMAISDYYVSSALSLPKLSTALYDFIEAKTKSGQEVTRESIQTLLMGDKLFTQHNKKEKISSKEQSFLKLNKTPKIIDLVKKISPKTVLVGFKLLNDVSEEVLIKAAIDQVDKAGCDVVVANDLKTIDGEHHQALIIQDGTVLKRCHNKKEIASELVQVLNL